MNVNSGFVAYEGEEREEGPDVDEEVASADVNDPNDGRDERNHDGLSHD